MTLGACEAARSRGYKFKVVLAVDLDDTALGVYRANFHVGPKTARSVDVTELFAGKLRAKLSKSEKTLRRKCGRVDLLMAGPPCQGHSDLNNSSRRQDPRNSLYLRVVRAAKVLQPKVVIIENVPAVVHDKGHVVARAKNGLERMGYKVTSDFIEADAIGLAQTRRRHILVATKNGELDLAFLEELKLKRAKTVRDYIKDLVGTDGARLPLFDFASAMSKLNKKRVDYLYANRIHDLPNRKRPKCHRDDHSYVSMYGRLHWDKPAQTITSGFGSMGQGRFLHPSKKRTLTPHEAARLQGFPDFFRFTSISKRTALQTTIGNAVPPKIAAIFVDRLLECGHL
jgi:DNA (cytosine-5)-methyltransferase 1